MPATIRSAALAALAAGGAILVLAGPASAAPTPTSTDTHASAAATPTATPSAPLLPAAPPTEAAGSIAVPAGSASAHRAGNGDDAWIAAGLGGLGALMVGAGSVRLRRR